MKPIRHSESSSRSDLSKTTVSSCESLGKSVMFKYTSLREIPPPPPPTPPPASPVKSPAMHGHVSCSEIPIRNPLVKQAALAYLQPMAGRPLGRVMEQGLFGKFKEVCCRGQCGCLEWLHGTSTDEEDDSDLLMRQTTTGGG